MEDDNLHYKDTFIPRIERRDLFYSHHDVNLEKNRLFLLEETESLYLES
jgi:hypothetical protein